MMFVLSVIFGIIFVSSFFVYICGRKWLFNSASKKTTGKISKIPGLIRVEKQLLIFFDKMKKTYFMVLALASMLCLGFNSCGDDDDDDSSSNSSSTTSSVDSTTLKNAVGTYKATSVLYLAKSDGTLTKYDDVAGSSDEEETATVKVTAQGTTGLLITDSEDATDVTTCTGLSAIASGLSFNVSALKQDGITVKGYNKSGAKYNGSFNSSTKTIVYYQQMSTSEFFAAIGSEMEGLEIDDATIKMYPTIVIENTLTKQ